METLEQQDVEQFTETVKEYDSLCRLDTWYKYLSVMKPSLLMINVQVHNIIIKSQETDPDGGRSLLGHFKQPPFKPVIVVM